ncbi:MAG: hypothetical protein SVK54_04345 [candidate division WOR-3 bacterium]|nr:hypothetical protein [candidate division WOR-3 bacterium]
MLAVNLYSGHEYGLGIRYENYQYLYYPEDVKEFSGWIPLSCHRLYNDNAELNIQAGLFLPGIYLSAEIVPYELRFSSYSLKSAIGYSYSSVLSTLAESNYVPYVNIDPVCIKKDLEISIYGQLYDVFQLGYSRVFDFAQNFTMQHGIYEKSPFYSYVLKRYYDRLSLTVNFPLEMIRTKIIMTYVPYSHEYSGEVRLLW